MSIRSKLRSKLIGALVSERTQNAKRSIAETRRKLGGSGHVISAFLELDDPWSYLLVHYLPDLAAAFDIELRYYLTQSCNDEAFRPETELLALYADEDCARVAAELGIPFLDKGAAPPVEHRRALIDSLAAVSDSPEFDSEFLEAITAYWRGDTAGVERRIGAPGGDGRALLAANQQRLVDLGHYNSAMLHYAGEWYWGVDRLPYLVDRLDELGTRRPDRQGAKLASIRQAMQVSLPVRPPGAAADLPALELFYSFRSPYSYLALSRVFGIADAFGLRLEVRPVLPMVMRGMQVPRAKLSYIVFDTAREARRLGVPYGKFADPVGAGVERCLAVYYYAQQERRERDFLLHAGEAIWARGIDVATDEGMRKVTARCGLFWPEVLAAMEDEGWREKVEDNRAAMFDAGCWGVPTLRHGDFTTWGQDRLWLLERHLEELCDSGEGILV
ncbi:MAG: DsbA family protein [Woeseiaceae bacterium]|nr:DsbA family protein [Woeseiaceae bacterium]